MTLTAWQEQQSFNSRRDALIAQGARVGRSTHKIYTKGRGDIRVPQVVEFALTFVEQPVFTSGLALHGGALVEHLYPLATVGVYQWRQDARGMYTGAYIWVSVTDGLNKEFAGAQYLTERQAELAAYKSYGVSLQEIQMMTVAIAQAKAEQAANQYQLEHHLAFEAMAIRDIDFDRLMAD